MGFNLTTALSGVIGGIDRLQRGIANNWQQNHEAILSGEGSPALIRDRYSRMMAALGYSRIREAELVQDQKQNLTASKNLLGLSSVDAVA